MKVFARKPLNLDQVLIPRGQVYLIPERCKGCKLCVEFCPRDVLVESQQTNSKGYHYRLIIFSKTFRMKYFLYVMQMLTVSLILD